MVLSQVCNSISLVAIVRTLKNVGILNMQKRSNVVKYKHLGGAFICSNEYPLEGKKYPTITKSCCSIHCISESLVMATGSISFHY